MAAHQYQPWFAAGLVFLETDEYEELDRAVRRGRDVANRTGSEWAAPAYDALASFGALRTGDLGDAAALALAALDSCETGDGFGLTVWCHSFLAQIALARGDLPTARERLRLAEGELSPTRSQLGWDHVMMVRSCLAEIDGSTGTALEAIAEVWDVFGAFDIPSARQWIGPRLVRLSLAAGNLARAEAVVAGLDDGVDRSGLLSFRVDAEQAHALLECDGDRASDAVELARMTARKPQLADALVDAADVWRRCGSLAKADDSALEASALFTGIGADAWAAARRGWQATTRRHASVTRHRALDSGGRRSRKANGSCSSCSPMG